MAEHKLSLAEKETVFLWNESDDVVQIETYSKKLIKRLHRIQEKHPTQYRVDEPDRHGCVYAEVPKNLLQITFREPVSEQRREKMSQLAKVRFFTQECQGEARGARLGVGQHPHPPQLRPKCLQSIKGYLRLKGDYMYPYRLTNVNGFGKSRRFGIFDFQAG